MRALLRGSGPSQRTRLLASSYLSYLAWVERHVPLQAGAARQLATRVVSIETAFTLGRTLPARPPGTAASSVHNLRFADGKLQLELRWTSLPAGTALSGIGYERPLPRGAWTQPAEPRPVRNRGRKRTARDQRPAPAGLQADQGAGRRLSQRLPRPVADRPRRSRDLLSEEE